MSQADDFQPGSLYEIRYSEICPWLILVKSLRVSVLLRVLALALIGVLLTEWGWALLDRSFGTTVAAVDRITMSDTVPVDAGPVLLNPSEDLPQPVAPTFDSIDRFSKYTFPSPLARGWAWLTGPWVRSTTQNTTWSDCLVSVLAGVWAVLVWAIFGGAISRIAALFLTRGEMLGPWQALKNSVAKSPATAGGPLIALIAATGLALPLVVVGLVLRLDLAALVVGLLWIVALGWGLMLATVLLGLLLGWPLMWATIGVERSDAFDSVSRCYAYVYQRPLQLIFYLLVASVLGLIGELAVDFFVAAGISLTEWTASWGAGNLRVAQLAGSGSADTESLSGAATTAANFIQMWKYVLLSVAAAYPLAFLWCAAIGIYLLLRRHIDSTEMDEISLTEPEPTEGIPDLSRTDGGVPQVRTEDADSDSNAAEQ